MQDQHGERIIHGYDPVQRRVLCGVPEQTGSTKHAAAVTCSACLELLHATPRTAPGDPDGARQA